MPQAGFSKSERFLEIGDAEKLHFIRERFGHADKAVPIRVCLHHREHLGGADSFADHAGVVPQRAAIDLSPASVSFSHLRFGVVMCGSRKYIGSSGGKTKVRFASAASLARICADG